MNVKCPPSAHLDIWSLAGGTALDGCGTFRGWNLTGGSKPLGWDLKSVAQLLSYLLSAFWLLMQCDQPPHASHVMAFMVDSSIKT